jgi:hypothetical protein
VLAPLVTALTPAPNINLNSPTYAFSPVVNKILGTTPTPRINLSSPRYAYTKDPYATP